MPSSFAYCDYRRVAELGIANVKSFQKAQRNDVLNPSSDYVAMINNRMVPVGRMQDPEVYWRINGLMVWHKAIVEKSAASRDYADWLSPYLRPGAFEDPSYADFWLNELTADAVPLNRLNELVSFYQLDAKITHGNAQDQAHAQHWLLNDLFFTADRQFQESLLKVTTYHFPEKSPPRLIIRSADSFVAQLESMLPQTR